MPPTLSFDRSAESIRELAAILLEGFLNMHPDDHCPIGCELDLCNEYFDKRSLLNLSFLLILNVTFKNILILDLSTYL